LTVLNFCNYSAHVDAELKSLEAKVGQFVELCLRLREDNQQLRQQLASAVSQTKRLEEKITSATSRLETLLAQMPPEEDAGASNERS
jgi:cell division protein ZapB